MRLFKSPWNPRSGQRGQALVEFSLVIMIFMTVVIAIAEFGFFLTVKTGLSVSAQDAVQYAAELGTNVDADFLVLQLVEKDVSLPLDKTKIQSVEIIHTDPYGTANTGEDKYTRGGSFPNNANTLTVPYTPVSSGYLPTTRCNTVATSVCGGVHYVAVKITYQYAWVTPLPGLVGLGGAPTFVQTSVMRLEPIQ